MKHMMPTGTDGLPSRTISYVPTIPATSCVRLVNNAETRPFHLVHPLPTTMYVDLGSEGVVGLRRFRIAICLVAIVVITQSANAQSRSNTASGNQESAKSNSHHDEGGTETSSDAQIISLPPKQGRLFSRVGLLVAPYHSSATIATNGQLLSGGTAEASNNMSVTFDLGYEVTKNISVTVTSGIPVKPHVTGEGSAAALGVLGKVRYGPMILAGQYRFPKIGRIRPYVGGGAAYAIIFKNFDGSVKNLQVNNNWGSVVQGGAEYEVNSKYTLFFDFKEVWLSVNAHGVLSDGTPVTARVKLNPSLITLGIKFHLPFGRSR
jgi:outer membrane protein